jgi:EmrB/QacA subfamily drug resistance transporter
VKGKWWTLVGSCFGLFILMLDSAAVALALPSIRGDLGASPEQLQWVMNVYLLTIAVLVVTAGRLGDMFGRKRVFLIGLVAFALGSVVSGAAGDADVLILGRVLQGAGAAPCLALSLALVVNVFPPEERARALGIWAAVSAIALAIGPLVGGILIEIDWRVIFWLNLPVAALGVFITARAAPESTDPGSGTKIDWPGLAALSVGLTAVVLALIQSQAWSGAAVIVLAAIGLAALGLFWRVEHRVPEPIVEFALFRNGPYFGASAAAFALVGAYWAVIFFQPQYLQDVRGHSPIACGLLVLPITVPMVLISPFSGRLIGRFGARALMTAGMACGLVGLIVPNRRRQLLRAAAGRLPAVRDRAWARLRADVDGGDGGDAGREVRDRCRGAGDGPGACRSRRTRRHRRDLPRPARRRPLLCRLDRRLDLARGRPRGRRHRPHLGLRPRPRAAGAGPRRGR